MALITSKQSPQKRVITIPVSKPLEKTTKRNPLDPLESERTLSLIACKPASFPVLLTYLVF